MKILIIGSGGREHAIGWKLSTDSRVEKLYFAPGNGGTSAIGENVDIQVDELDKLLEFAVSNDIELTVVGPELPLTLGVVDKFKAAGRKIFGPDKASAELEGSKAFAKAFMQKYDIPTAGYGVYTDIDSAIKAVESAAFPIVIKADGIAAGKGVIICEDSSHAKAELEEILVNRRFGDAGGRVVIEEFLRGVEASILCFTDGKTIKPMVSAQDYKRALDGDLGLNTGGMGAVSPAFAYTAEHEKIFTDRIMSRALKGIADEGMDYRGVLYFGLMIDGDDIKVLEFNARFGDPETEAVLLRLKTPLLDIINAVCDRELEKTEIEWDDAPAICVIAASKGYPGKYKTGVPISIGGGNAQIFHAGTEILGGQLVTNGGRVLAVSAMAKDLTTARREVYNTLKDINFDGMQYRKDIGNEISL